MSLATAGQQILFNNDAFAIESQNPALLIHSYVKVSLRIDATGIRSFKTAEDIRHGRTIGLSLLHIFEP